MKTLKLQWRLLCCFPKLIRAITSGGETRLRLVVSEIEACHRDLGHEHDANRILRGHAGPMA